MYTVMRTRDGKVAGVKRAEDGACIPLDEDNSDYRALVEWNAQQPAGERLSLEDQEPHLDYLKEQKRAALDAWLAAEEAAGFTPPGKTFALRLGSYDQSEFNKLDTALHKLKTAGLVSSSTAIPLAAADGRTYDVTVAEWEAISVAYSAECLVLWSRYAAYRDRIAAAASAAELDAIHLE